MITSMQNKTVKELLKLKQKKYRKDYYLVETNHLVEEAIKAKQTDLIISTEPVDLDVENLVVSKEIMEKLAFTKTPQPIMARCFIQKNYLSETQCKTSRARSSKTKKASTKTQNSS